MRKKLPKTIMKVKHALGKKSPVILTATGIVSMGTAIFFAGKGTVKAVKLVEEKERELDVDLTTKAKVQECWKCYIPSAATAIFGTACLIGAHSVHARRNAAIVTAYKLSETALMEFKETVSEEFGEEKAKEIKEKITKKHINENPVTKSNVIITDSGEQLCYDGVSGRYFKSDLNTIKKAINEVNRHMTYEMYVSLSEFYDELNLPHTDVSDHLGWNLDDGLLDISFGSMIADDGRPCITLEYHVAPKYDFASLL